jgi:tryptophanyl-tRNA synthetase
MSKSLGPKHHVALFEAEASIRSKIRAAVTDVGGERCEASPGVWNLFQILAETAPTAELERLDRAREEGSLRYSELKEAVTTHLLATLAPLRRRRASLRESDARTVLVDGASRARTLARATLQEVRDRVGILDPSRSR